MSALASPVAIDAAAVAMSATLRALPALDDRIARIACYARTGLPDYVITDLDGEALSRERLRRRLFRPNLQQKAF